MRDLDAAIESLRAMTRGPKGDRLDYVGTLSTASATTLLAFIDLVKPFYDTHPISEAEMRYLRTYRALPPEGRAELERFARFLASPEQREVKGE